MDYRTKPVELPISTDKEYVLVDKYGFTVLSDLSYYNKMLCERFNLDDPFKFHNTEGFIGFINEFAINDGIKELKYFHEIVRENEKPKQNKRELLFETKLNLAYDLFLVRHDLERNDQAYKLFINNDQAVLGFLAIVEKTNYGKEK